MPGRTCDGSTRSPRTPAGGGAAEPAGRWAHWYGPGMMRKLFWLLLLGGLGYGAYWYLNKEKQPGQP